MAAYQIQAISPARVDRILPAQVRTDSRKQVPSAAPLTQPTAPQRRDVASFSPESLALNRLVRMWGSLTSLFGPQRPQGAQSPWGAAAGPDLAQLRNALLEARKNAEAVELRAKVTDTLKSSALRQAEQLVDNYYGLQGDGTAVKVRFENSMDGALASVTFQYDEKGRTANPQLHINMSQFAPDTGPNGVNSHIIQNDRIVAHEMTHLIMGRNMDLASLPDWFAEGTAEYISGGAERVGIALRYNSPQQLVGLLRKPWAGDSDSYAAGYLAVRFLNEQTQGNGGLKAIMQELKSGASLDQAINTVSEGRYQSTKAFLNAFTQTEGVDFIKTIDLSGRDAGSIKPGSGPAVVPDQGAPTSQPLRGFRIQWPSPLEGLPQYQAAYARQMPNR